MSLFNKAYETYEYHKSLVGMIEAGKIAFVTNLAYFEKCTN